MFAFLIDPARKQISRVEYDHARPNLGQAYMYLNCDTVDAVRLENGDCIFIDDEGLLKMDEHSAFWGITDPERLCLQTNVLTGRGLVVGTDAEGNSCPPKISMRELQQRVAGIAPEKGRELAQRALDMSGTVRTFDSDQEMQDYLDCINGRR